MWFLCDSAYHCALLLFHRKGFLQLNIYVIECCSKSELATMILSNHTLSLFFHICTIQIGECFWLEQIQIERKKNDIGSGSDSVHFFSNCGFVSGFDYFFQELKSPSLPGGKLFLVSFIFGCTISIIFNTNETTYIVYQKIWL